MSESKKILKMSGLLSNTLAAKNHVQSSLDTPFPGLPIFQPPAPFVEIDTPVAVPLDLIDRSPYQIRSPVKAERVETLASEIRRHGMNNPVIVRPITGGRYELVAGETRVAAYRINGETHIQAFVRPMDDGQSARSLVLDNFHHGDLSDYEVYKGLVVLKQVLLDGGKIGSLSEIAELTPWGKSQIHRLMSFAKLPQLALESLEVNPSALGSQAASDLSRLIDSGIGEDILTEAIQRILSGELEQGRAAEWILGASEQASPSKNEIVRGKQSPPRSSRAVRAITAENGRLICTIERTPKGFNIKGHKGIDWVKLEDELATWLSSRIEF
jgi:ParB family chromosome partitioning protein